MGKQINSGWKNTCRFVAPYWITKKNRATTLLDRVLGVSFSSESLTLPMGMSALVKASSGRNKNASIEFFLEMGQMVSEIEMT